MLLPFRILVILLAGLLAIPAIAGKDEFVDLADRGWNYQLRTTMLGRDLSIPVRISGQTLAGAALCIVGDPPAPSTRAVLNTFRDLAAHIFGKQIPMRYAGPTSDLCGAGRTVVLRLYSGLPPNKALSDDLNRMSETYGLGLPPGRFYVANSPAMAQTFFGRHGQPTHIMVAQPRGPTTILEALFYKSILIEELYQSFTFGMDVLVFERDAAFLSKLQEFPVNPQRMAWTSPAFMRALLSSNPTGLCDFDVFMMHAVARAPVHETNDPAFIEYIEQSYDELSERMKHTLAENRFATILDPDCRPHRD